METKTENFAITVILPKDSAETAVKKSRESFYICFRREAIFKLWFSLCKFAQEFVCMFRNLEQTQLLRWRLFNSRMRSGARVLFALGEVRMHAWSALHCLTVVFSRCHRLAVVMVLCALGPSRVEKRAERQRSRPRHSRLPRHLIVRKVSAGPSEPGASAVSLSAGPD